MKYSAHPKYKNSGVEWLGDVPVHWDVKRLKYSSNTVMGQSPSSDEYSDDSDLTPFLQGNADFTDRFPMPRIYCEKANKIIGKGALLISVRAPVGALNEADQTYSIGRGLCAVIPQNKLLKEYSWYALQITREELNTLATGSTYDAVSTDEVGNMSFPLPPLPEQQAIADFLDRETGQIDLLIGKKKKFVELLKEKRTALISRAVTKGLNPKVKMKPSGIEWLGDVPEHWEIKKIKHLTKVISKGTTPSTEGFEILEEGEIRFIKAENLVENSLSLTPEFFIDHKTNAALCRSILEENDVLIVIAGATIGKVAILEKRFLPANTNQAVCFIRLKRNHLSKLFWYYMQSDIIKNLIVINSVQSAQPNISMGLLKELIFPMAPPIEQEAIATFLDRETAKIDMLAAKVEAAIEKLKEYRTTLISAAVTGKIDVSTGLNTGKREVA